MEYSRDSPVFRSKAQEITTPAKIVRVNKGQKEIILNNGNSFLLYKIYDEIRFKGIKKINTVSQEIADFEPFLSSGIFSVSKDGLVEIIDYSQSESFEIVSTLNLKKLSRNFSEGVEAVACAISKNASFAVVSTAKKIPGSQNPVQHTLSLLSLDDDFNLTILDSINDPQKDSRKSNRCYTHLRFYNSIEYENPLLLCFEGKQGYMEVFEKELNLNFNYSVDVFMVKGSRLCFVECIKDYHLGKSFKNEEIDGCIWSIDNTGRISQISFD